MEPMSRRTALTLGGIGAAVVVAGGAGLVWMQTNQSSPTTTPTTPGTGTPAAPGDKLGEPEVLRSAGGVLDVTLVAAESAVVIGGTSVRALTFNGGVPGPTLVVRPGDVLSVAFQNQLAMPTNLHTHGLHVSPDGISDNVFLRIDPGAQPTTATRSRRIIPLASTGTTRTTTEWRRNRSLAGCTGRSSSRIPRPSTSPLNEYS